jgi:hypothetical protein
MAEWKVLDSRSCFHVVYSLLFNILNILNIRNVDFDNLGLLTTMDTATNEVLMLQSKFLEPFLGIPDPEGATSE